VYCGLALLKLEYLKDASEIALLVMAAQLMRYKKGKDTNKALTHPSMFPKDDFGDQCRGIFSTSTGCGYTALHNII
jgi:hypothetical protein